MTGPRSIAITTPSAMAAAYSATAPAWPRGPGLVYDRLAAELVAHSPRSLCGATVADIGAGTGAASRAATMAGAARVIAIDTSWGMLASDARARPPAVVGDALHLPLRTSCVDIVVSAFSLNHVADPTAGFVEAARVLRPGGTILASTYASDDTHPVKAAVEEALTARGWVEAPWYTAMRQHAAARLATVRGCTEVVRAAGMDATVYPVRVAYPTLRPDDLLAWRLGLAQHAPFVATLSPDERLAVEEDAMVRLGNESPPLVRSMLVIVARF